MLAASSDTLPDDDFRVVVLLPAKPNSGTEPERCEPYGSRWTDPRRCG